MTAEPITGHDLLALMSDVCILRQRAVKAEAVASAAWAFAKEMRSYCSPHGVAADYADRLEERLRAAESAPVGSAGPSGSPAVHGETGEAQEGKQ